ncbi:hypothetical protein K439DRAFT_1372203 [Ramaria rubella]|nr:hypothetical protein K439DRAFT_1372203 [Ramaria rubella]
MAPSNTHRWWRAYYYDHHKYNSKAAELMDKSSKAKVWCILCFDNRLACEIADDGVLVLSGKHEMSRSQSIIQEMTSAGLPLKWVENPEWLLFCEHFVPCAKSPSCKVLKPQATASCDGWTGEDKHHFIAFMVTCNAKTHTVRVHDASAERKTADNLYKLMVEVINELQDNWGMIVIAFTSDAGGESLKAWKMIWEKYLHIVMPDCQTLQINLIVGDFFKCAAGFLSEASKATELIGWLWRKTYVLALLREVQVANLAPTPMVICAVLTRWTYHYLACRHLLELHLSLQTLVDNYERLPTGKWQLILVDKDARAKSQVNIAVIKSSALWHALVRMKNYLEPLAIAANVTQAASCHVDQVLITFACLHIHYSALLDAQDSMAQNVILSSIEQRWHKTDQDVFVVGTFLNVKTQIHFQLFHFSPISRFIFQCVPLVLLIPASPIFSYLLSKSHLQSYVHIYSHPNTILVLCRISVFVSF